MEEDTKNKGPEVTVAQILEHTEIRTWQERNYSRKTEGPAGAESALTSGRTKHLHSEDAPPRLPNMDSSLGLQSLHCFLTSIKTE